MKRLLVIGLAITLVFLFIAAPHRVAAATTYTVNSTSDAADPNAGTPSAACANAGTCTLRDAIMDANAVGGAVTINIPTAGSYILTIAAAGADTDATGDLNITDATGTVRINGATGVIINGGAVDRIFNIAAGAATVINDVVITNGNSSGDLNNNGGAILDGGSLTLTNSTVENSTGGATASGDGIEVDPGTATLSNDVITNNASAGTGTFSTGAGIDINGNTTITNTTISNNRFTACTVSCEGGGVDTGVLLPATTTITNSTISGNVIAGGLTSFSDSAGLGANDTITLTNDTISGNSITGATSAGGGVGLFLNNPSVVVNVTVADNSSPALGDANIQFNGSHTTFSNSVFSDPLGGGSDCSGVTLVNDNGSNIASDGSCALTATGDLPNTDPKLNALANNGGPTQTEMPQAGSPTIGGASSGCPATDQRGVTRPTPCTIGATEFAPFSTPTSTPTPIATPSPSASIPVPSTGARTDAASPPLPMALALLTIGISFIANTRRRSIE